MVVRSHSVRSILLIQPDYFAYMRALVELCARIDLLLVLYGVDYFCRLADRIWLS